MGIYCADGVRSAIIRHVKCTHKCVYEITQHKRSCGPNLCGTVNTNDRGISNSHVQLQRGCDYRVKLIATCCHDCDVVSSQLWTRTR